MSKNIFPDKKSWTWVLEKRCEDCGFDASTFDTKRTGAAVRDISTRWQVALALPDVGVRPQPTIWSPLEYGCHVRDVFRVFDERLALMLSQDDPRFANWDQDSTAIEDDYSNQDAREVAVQPAEAGARLADRFDSVSGNQWERCGIRSDGSTFTVNSLGRYFMHDPLHHLWDVGAEVFTYE